MRLRARYSEAAQRARGSARPGSGLRGLLVLLLLSLTWLRLLAWQIPDASGGHVSVEAGAAGFVEAVSGSPVARRPQEPAGPLVRTAETSPMAPGASDPRSARSSQDPILSELPELSEPSHAEPVWSNRDPLPSGLVLDPRDLQALADIIEANGLGEASSPSDFDDHDGVLEPLELGLQRWRGGRLVALVTGGDRYDSFGYALKVLPPSVGNLGALEELDLNSNRIEALPVEIGRLQRLEVLRVHRNALSALPDSIAGLRSLRELAAGENGLRELPPGIASLDTLEELHANDNPLTALPDGVGRLPRLRVLNLSHEPLVDPASAAADRIAEADPDPRLGSLPSSFERLDAIETLHLAGNRLFCAGGAPNPALAPARLRDGSIPHLHGLTVQDCGGAGSP